MNFLTLEDLVGYCDNIKVNGDYSNIKDSPIHCYVGFSSAPNLQLTAGKHLLIGYIEKLQNTDK